MLITRVVLLERSGVLWTVYFVLLCVVQHHDDVRRKKWVEGGIVLQLAEIAAISQRTEIVQNMANSCVFLPKRY